jgi:hypothetical protein
MEEVSIPEAEAQVDRTQLAVIVSIVFGLAVIVAAVTMLNRRALKVDAVEVIPADQVS